MAIANKKWQTYPDPEETYNQFGSSLEVEKEKRKRLKR
jgi:hypothetical protein